MPAKERIKSSLAFGKDRKKNTHETNTSNLIPVPKGSKRERKRIGQGPGSGMGKTSTRGQKGQRARASSMRVDFEGGQMPLHKRLPKSGFTNIFHKSFQPVNLRDMTKVNLSGTITPEILEEKGLIKNSTDLIKILGTGDLKSGIQIVADSCSASALDKIQKAGGSFTKREKVSKKTEK